MVSGPEIRETHIEGNSLSSAGKAGASATRLPSSPVMGARPFSDSLDLDALAAKVYDLLKARLRAERDRQQIYSR
jgi:hypothetical protein